MTSYRTAILAPMVKACDHLGQVTLEQAGKLRADGYEAIGLYASVASEETIFNCTTQGLAIFWILLGLAGAETPSAALGDGQARAAIARLRGFGVADGPTLFSDIEGRGDAPRTPEQWTAYANGAAVATNALKWDPGGYFGDDHGLSAAQMYALAVNRYWKGASRTPEPECGFCAVQGFPTDYLHVPSGLRIDLDALWWDYEGRAVAVTVRA